MKVTVSDISIPKKGSLVLTTADAKKLGANASKVDKDVQSVLSKAIKINGFKAEKGEIISTVAPEKSKFDYVFLVGLGQDIDETAMQSVGGKIFASLNAAKISDATVIVEGVSKSNLAKAAANLAYGVVLRSYQFNNYKRDKKPEDAIYLNKITVQSADSKNANSKFKELENVSKGVFLARDVVTMPPNKLYPESYANVVKKEFTKLPVKVKILGEKEMAKLGMGALLGVGQGSIRESKLVVIEYNGAQNKKDKPVAFVGKGVTFDTGGISLKPSNGMEDMKYDMGGSAAVVGTMKALVERKAKVNAVGIIGLVENMPDGNAQRPSDVVTSMSGRTIEVLNTDAEGRLVLVDALTYTQEKYKPKFVVNLATLTGAIVVALGDLHAGLFSNNDELSERLQKAGEVTDEKLWRLPIGGGYDKMIDSPIADVKNIGSGRGAGSITAAQFLYRFIENDTPWAHLDIAGVAWNKEGGDVCPKGATGYGVRLLDRLVKDFYEK